MMHGLDLPFKRDVIRRRKTGHPDQVCVQQEAQPPREKFIGAVCSELPVSQSPRDQVAHLPGLSTMAHNTIIMQQVPIECSEDDSQF